MNPSDYAESYEDGAYRKYTILRDYNIGWELVMYEPPGGIMVGDSVFLHAYNHRKNGSIGYSRIRADIISEDYIEFSLDNRQARKNVSGGTISHKLDAEGNLRPARNWKPKPPSWRRTHLYNLDIEGFQRDVTPDLMQGAEADKALSLCHDHVFHIQHSCHNFNELEDPECKIIGNPPVYTKDRPSAPHPRAHQDGPNHNSLEGPLAPESRELLDSLEGINTPPSHTPPKSMKEMMAAAANGRPQPQESKPKERKPKGRRAEPKKERVKPVHPPYMLKPGNDAGPRTAVIDDEGHRIDKWLSEHQLERLINAPAEDYATRDDEGHRILPEQDGQPIVAPHLGNPHPWKIEQDMQNIPYSGIEAPGENSERVGKPAAKIKTG